MGAWMWGLESTSNSEAESKTWGQVLGYLGEASGLGQALQPCEASVSPLVRHVVGPQGLCCCLLLRCFMVCNTASAPEVICGCWARKGTCAEPRPGHLGSSPSTFKLSLGGGEVGGGGSVSPECTHTWGLP